MTHEPAGQYCLPILVPAGTSKIALDSGEWERVAIECVGGSEGYVC